MDRDRRDPDQPGTPDTPGTPATPGVPARPGQPGRPGPGGPDGPDVRLEEVRQSDLGESRVNEEFVDWLKTKGINYLLVVLIALVGFIAWVRVKEGRDAKRDAAWVQYVTAVNSGGPEMLEQVAAMPEIAGTDGIGALARTAAAERYLRAVLAGRQLAAPLLTDAEVPVEPPAITEELRTEYLERADALYADIVAADDGSNGMAIHVWSALDGRGSVAEARGDGEAAASFFEQAADRVDAWYPQLAARSRALAATAVRFSEPVLLPTAAEARSAAAAAPAARPTPMTVDPVLESLIDPAGDDEADGGS